MDARSTETPDELTRFDKQEGRSQSLANLNFPSAGNEEKLKSNRKGNAFPFFKRDNVSISKQNSRAVYSLIKGVVYQ